MKNCVRFYMALVVLMGLVAGLAGTGGRASAHVLADTLPTTKNPASARFDFSGNIKLTASGESFSEQLSGSGATSGSDLQEDETVSVTAPDLSGTGASGLGGSTGSSGPMTTTTSIILKDGKAYFKSSGLGSSNPDQWYEIDLSDTTSLSIPGMVSDLIGGSTSTGMPTMNPDFSDAYKITTVGKATVEGAATTEYRIDVDYNKLVTDLAGGDVSPSDLGSTDFTIYANVWIGDNDQYIHKLFLSANGSSTDASAPGSLAFDFTMTFRDFDAAITITAPANAQPLDSSSLGSLLGVPGLDTGMPGTSGMGGMTGMPKTGAHSPGELPLVPVSFALAALLLMGGGFTLRKLSTAKVRV